MQNVLDCYNRIWEEQDIFKIWKNELFLRHELRKSIKDPGDIRISNQREIDFLYRSLFFSGAKNHFFAIMFENLNLMPVINWITLLPEPVKKDFLAFLPWYINKRNPEPHRLQFIINLYHKDFSHQFRQIINTLNIDSCRFLIARTANSDLRKMFKERENYLCQLNNQYSYGVDMTNFLDYPSLYGNKSQLAVQAIDVHRASLPQNFDDPYNPERVGLLLQMCDILWGCGMIEDSLAYIIEIYRDYRQKARLATIIEDNLTYKQFSKLLRKIIPVYSLLFAPHNSYITASYIYDQYFPEISKEETSLLFLDLYESVVAGLNTNNHNILYEILFKTSLLLKLRPGEPPLLYEREVNHNMSDHRQQVLIDILTQKIKALPHESFITMEMLRLLFSLNHISNPAIAAPSLLEYYLKFFKWVPSKIFLNESIVKQLVPWVEETYRIEPERILKMLTEYDRKKIVHDLTNRADIFKNKDNTVRRLILTGMFTGVLE